MKRTKRFAEGGFSEEQESWLGGADRTDPYILARMRKAVPDALPPVEDRKATPVADIKPAVEAAPQSDMMSEKEPGWDAKSEASAPATRSSAPSPAKAAPKKAKSAGAGRGFVNPTAKDTAGAVLAAAARAPKIASTSAKPEYGRKSGSTGGTEIALAAAAARTAARDADYAAREEELGADARAVQISARDRSGRRTPGNFKSGGAVKKMASGGKTGGRGDGIAQRGKTRGRMC